MHTNMNSHAHSKWWWGTQLQLLQSLRRQYLCLRACGGPRFLGEIWGNRKPDILTQTWQIDTGLYLRPEVSALLATYLFLQLLQLAPLQFQLALHLPDFLKHTKPCVRKRLPSPKPDFCLLWWWSSTQAVKDGHTDSQPPEEHSLLTYYREIDFTCL